MSLSLMARRMMTSLVTSSRSVRGRTRLLNTVTPLEDRVVPSVADWAEPNNVRTEATYLGRSQLQWSGLSINSTTDVDWLSFRIDNPGLSGHTVGIQAVSTGYDLDIELYDNAGNYLTGSYSASGTESISLAGRPAGRYFLRVNGYNGATGNYTFKLNGPANPDAGDFTEFNDSPSTAFTIPTRGGSFNMFGMNIHTTTDVDWFFVRLANTGTASDFMQMDFTHSAGDLDMRLYHESNLSSAVRSSEGVTNQEKFALTGLAAGNYYLKAYGYSGAKNTSGYSLTMNLPQPGTGPTGDWAESNNTTASATNLGTLTTFTQRGSLSIHTSSDQDYFQFRLASSGTSADFVQINFSHALGDLDMELLDSNGKSLGFSAGVSDTEKLSLAGLQSGKDYFVRVYGFAGATNSNYTLSISPPPSLAPDNKETNNSQATATDLGLSASMTKATFSGLSIHSSTDQDWFRVNLIAPGTSATFGRIDFNNAQGDLDLALFNSAGVLLRNSEGLSDFEQISFDGLGTGVYFLRVIGFNGATNSNYTITVVGPTPTAVADRFEVNNTVATATNLGTIRGTPPPITGLSLHNSTDVDFFSFSLAGPGQTGHQVQVSFTHSKGDIDIFLRDAAGNRINGRSSAGVDNTETISFAGLNAATYYLEVLGYQGATNSDYSISFIAPQSGGLQPDRLESNNTTATASQLRTASGSETGLTIHNNSDVDLFRFVTTETSTANHFGRITFNSADGNLDIALLDASGNLLANGSQATNAETVSLAGRPAGTYFLRVTGAAGAMNSYDLSWNTPIGVVGTAGDAWTIMVYMNSSNLPSKADINEMERAIANGLPASVNIVVYLDQNSSPSKAAYNPFPTGNGTQPAWGTAGYGVVIADTSDAIATPFTIIGERNSGDPATLTDFMKWAKQNAPAQKYALLMWDHGAGVRFGMNHDDEGGNNTVGYLTVNELRQGIQNSGISLSLLGFDMCLMGMTEVTYALRDMAPVIVASQELVDGPGFNYTTSFNVLRTNPGSVSAEQLASGLVSSFQTQYVRPGNNLDTLSAVRSSEMGNLANALLNFVNAVGTNPSSTTLTALRQARDASAMYGEDLAYGYRDLGQFVSRIANNTSLPQNIRAAAQAVNSALDTAVFSRTQDRRGSSGLAIYLPSAGRTYNSQYVGVDQASFFAQATLWGQLANLIAGGTTGRSVILTAPDQFESNDFASVASNLNTINGAGNQITGLNLHSADDVDYFRFTTVSSGQATIQVLAQEGESVWIELLSEDGSSITSNSGQSAAIAAPVSQGQSYLVRVSSANGSTSSNYTLTIDAPENRNVSGAAGANNLRERAFPLGTVSGNEMFTGFVLTDAGQTDWYSFETPRLLTPLDVQLTALFTSSSPVTVVLEDASGGLIAQGSGTRNVTLNFPMNSGQEYIIRVTNNSGQTVPYSLSFRTLSNLNTRPGISSVPDVTIAANTSFGPFAFTLDDFETPNQLTVTATSSNPDLVPVSGIQISGSGTSRMLVVTPNAGASGSSLITLTVMDPLGATSTEVFLLTVTPPNNPGQPPINPGQPPVSPGQQPNQPVSMMPRDLRLGTREYTVGSDVGGSTVRFLSPSGQELFSLNPFPGFMGGVRTAAADFNRDGVADIVVGTGPGVATQVVVIDGKSQAVLFQIAPFEQSFTGGVYVAAGDITGDGVPELIITPDEGGGPRARVFNGIGFGNILDFYGIEDPNFRGGARAAVGDVTGDGKAELIIAAGFGGGPRIAVWDGSSIADGKLTRKPMPDFFVFEESLRNGTFVAVGDVTGDGKADFIFGGGPGGAPRVRVFDSAKLLAVGPFGKIDDVENGTQLANFFAGSEALRGGVRLSIKDLDNDDQADLVTGAGTGDGSTINIYPGRSLTSGTAAQSFEGIPGVMAGVFVG